MIRPLLHLRRSLPCSDWWPALRNGLLVVGLFAAGLWTAQAYREPIEAALQTHAVVGVGVFLASTVVAVLLPMLSNLALVPLAVVAWGPAWTATLLLLGWLGGAMASFAVGRHAQGWLLSRAPSLRRHADIDRLIAPDHRIGSLMLLRMTFPVDILSYALGLFSRRTTARENAVSTVFGAAPFACVFAWFPTLDTAVQGGVFVASAGVFLVYARWVLRRRPPGSTAAPTDTRLDR